MRKKKVIFFTIFFIVLFFICFFNFRKSTEDKMLLQGNTIIEKIETYIIVNNKLPNTLEDIGIEIKTENDPSFYYSKIDSSIYMLSYGTSLGESKYYYSDSKKWENHYRVIRE